MSWIVEKSYFASAVRVDNDTVTCTLQAYTSIPINVMYKDLAERNGEYFWQFKCLEVDHPNYSSILIGLTTEKGFQARTDLKAIQYSGFLWCDREESEIKFGDSIEQNDQIGLLLQLTDADLKVYIFHNDQPLGLAFHFQSPYPKALYPVVSFNTSAQIKISRSQEIPKSLDRSLPSTGLEGHWKIIDYPQHPECMDCEFQLKLKDKDRNIYRFSSDTVESVIYTLQYNPTGNQWQGIRISSTRIDYPFDDEYKQRLLGDLLFGIESLKLQDEQELIIRTNNNEQVRLKRSIKPVPKPITKYTFN